MMLRPHVFAIDVATDGCCRDLLSSATDVATIDLCRDLLSLADDVATAG